MYVLASYRTTECEPIALKYYDSESGALGVMIGAILTQTNDEASTIAQRLHRALTVMSETMANSITNTDIDYEGGFIRINARRDNQKRLSITAHTITITTDKDGREEPHITSVITVQHRQFADIHQ